MILSRSAERTNRDPDRIAVRCGGTWIGLSALLGAARTGAVGRLAVRRLAVGRLAVRGLAVRGLAAGLLPGARSGVADAGQIGPAFVLWLGEHARGRTDTGRDRHRLGDPLR